MSGGPTQGASRRSWQPRRPLRPPEHPILSAALFVGLVPPPVERDPLAWGEAVDDACRLHLAPHLRRLASDLGVELDEELRERLRSAERFGVARTLAAEASIAFVDDVFRRSGLRGVITKGRSIADADPVDPALRSYGDVDVVVHPDDFERAMGVIADAGFYDPAPVQLRASYDRHCREAVNLLHPNGAAVDVHHHIPPWIWGRRLRFAELWSCGRGDAVGLRVASDAHNALVSALHIISDHDRAGRSWRVWRDVAVLSNAAGSDVLDVARDAQLDWWLAYMIDQLPAGARPRWRDAHPVTPEPPLRDRIRLHLLLPPSIASRSSGAARLLRLPLRSLGVYVFSYVWPSRAARDAKAGEGSSYVAWWRATARKLGEDTEDASVERRIRARRPCDLVAAVRRALWVRRSVRVLRRSPLGSPALPPRPPAGIGGGDAGIRAGLRSKRAGAAEMDAIIRCWDTALGEAADPVSA